MIQRPFGSTGLIVSALGFGAGHIGNPGMPEEQVARILHSALDAGISLFDTARGYGMSEERIGRHLKSRRDEFVLSTKVGYGIPGFEDWTGPIIGAGVRAALQRLETDRIDIVHLHSCPLDVLKRGDVIEALNREVEAGRVLVAAYSGENDALEAAALDSRFRSIQCSINICDQWSLSNVIPHAAKRRLGVIGKRPAANVPWRFPSRPTGQYAEVYWDRWTAMQLDPRGLDWTELALRFAAYQPGVSSCIMGTGNLEHLQHAVDAVNKGALSYDHEQAIREAFARNGASWRGEV